MNNSKFLAFLIFIAITVVNYTYASIIDTFTEEDKAALAAYLQSDTTKTIENVPLKNYILNKLENGKNQLEKINGLKLIYDLTDQHKRYLDKAIINLIEKESKTEKAYHDYRQEEGAFGGSFTRGVYTLGNTRSELSIQYLLNLTEPIENWPEKIKENILANKDKETWIDETREDAVGALLQPLDQKGKELFPVLEEILKGYPSSAAKDRMIEKLEGFKNIYQKLEESGMSKYDLFK